MMVSGAIGCLFGVALAWVTYRYNKIRDDVSWEREKEKLRLQWDQEHELLIEKWQKEQEGKEKEWNQTQVRFQDQWEQEKKKLELQREQQLVLLQQQWEHDKELQILQFQQRLREYEQQIVDQEKIRLRDAILKGLDNPTKAILELNKLTSALGKQSEMMELGIRAIAQNAEHMRYLGNQTEGHYYNIEEKTRSLNKLLSEVQAKIEDSSKSIEDSFKSMEGEVHKLIDDIEQRMQFLISLYERANHKFERQIVPPWFNNSTQLKEVYTYIAIAIWISIPILIVILVTLIRAL